MTTRNILIVDDEPRVAFFLGKSLERSSRDYCVNVAHSGEEALDILNRASVDLLVTDLRLPGISGLDLMRWVRASSPKTRSILITAYGNDEVEAEARHLEAYRYITKPFHVTDFTQAVQEALRDMAVSQPGLVVLSDEMFEAITQQLEMLRSDVGARCIFLADMLGQRLAEVGVTTGLDIATVLSLLAGGFAATGELAHYFGSGEAINLNFHEGSRYEIYSANVGDNLFLAMFYDRRGQASRIGLVWLYARRAIERLLEAVSADKTPATAPFISADFGSSVMAELDTLLSSAPPQKEPERVETPRVAQPIPAAPSPQAPATAPNGGERASAEGGGELLDMETAIARGLIPPMLGVGWEDLRASEPVLSQAEGSANQRVSVQGE